jgi:cation:H+ antiporter
MITLWLTFIGLLLLIFVAALGLSYSSERFAGRWGANFVGSIVLALVTTLPEYLFVFWASVKGEFGVAIGSITGAAAMLVTLGYGLVILTATTRLSHKPVREIVLSPATRIDAAYLLVTAVVALLLAAIGDMLDITDAVILTVIFALYVWHVYRASRSLRRGGRAPQDGILDKKRGGADAESPARAGGNEKRVPIRVSVGLFILCGAIIVVASEPFVGTMVNIARRLNVHPIAIALILSPIASEMPEKLTAFVTVHRNGALAEISVCNFMGSKVNHNSLLLAVMVYVAAGSAHGAVHGIVVPAFLMMTGLTVIAALSLARGRLRRWQGWFFLLLFLLQVGVALIS